MSLRYALMGLLARESLTGYDLTKRFDSTVGFFWSAKHSQIYPELATLTKEGLVTFEVVTQTSKPNKKVYTLTDEGRAALTAWMGDEIDKRTVKDPLLMRVWALGVTEGADLLPQLKSCRDDLDKRLEYLEEAHGQATAHGAAAMSAKNPHLGMWLAMRAGELQYRAYRDWLVETIAALESLTD